MAEPFLGEIRLMSFLFAPKAWASCNGQLLPINQNQALFALLGTTYGGNGQTTFALPDLRGRVPIHHGGSHTQGERAGSESHTVTVNEMPAHAHLLQGTGNPGTASAPGGGMLAQRVAPAGAADRVFGDGFEAPGDVYGPAQSLVMLGAQAVVPAGGSQPHENMQPYLTIRFCIALQGIFPSRN